MPRPLTTPLRSNFIKSPIGRATSPRPSIPLRSIGVGLCQWSGPVTLGVVSGGSGVAAAAGEGGAGGATTLCGQDAAAEDRASGHTARKVATALAAAVGHEADGGDGACAQLRLGASSSSTNART